MDQVICLSVMLGLDKDSRCCCLHWTRMMDMWFCLNVTFGVYTGFARAFCNVCAALCVTLRCVTLT